MRSNRSTMALATAALAILSTGTQALDPGMGSSRMLHPTGAVFPPEVPSGPPMLSDACPATDLGIISGSAQVIGSTTGSTDDFDASAWGCGDEPGGRDEIFGFSVDSSGQWLVSTCDTATFDTSLGLYDGASGCPGLFLLCNGDGLGCGNFTSEFQAVLIAGATYYVVVDGWSTSTFGDFELNITNVSCTSDASCDDGDFCNGVEVCDGVTGECQASPPPCLPHQTCDSVTQECIDPDPCITWRSGALGGYFFPQANNCTTANWTFDDIQTSKHTTDALNWYEASYFGRSTPAGASPLGSVYLVDMALWTVTDNGACNPDAVIAGSECTEAGVIAFGGTDADVLRCTRSLSLPDNTGDFIRCEIDFFLGSRTGEQGAGWGIASGQQTIGGPAARDDFGVDVFWVEGCPADGVFSPTWFFDDVNVPADFGEVQVCQAPLGTCCAEDGSCSLTVEADCTGTWGAQIGTVADGLPACEGDVDGDGIDGVCGDNCPNNANPLQEDCDGDGEGDACEDAYHQDGDGDGVCNGDDNCPFTPNPGQEDCDGDLLGDHCDPCPCDNPDDSDGDGLCDSDDICPGHNDNVDTDGDHVPDGCDICPGSDDNAPGAQDDDDGDGVTNCTDQCPGVDDAIFAPECVGAIPTTSEWGLVVLTLLLLVGAKIGFGHNSNPVTLG